MARTLGQVVRDVRFRLGELSEGRWKDEQLRGWVNEAQRDIATRIPWNRQVGSVSAVAGTQEYDLPASAYLVHRVSYTETGTSTRLDLERWDFNNVAERLGGPHFANQGTPAIYWTWGYPGSTTFNLFVHPTPSVDGTFQVHYYGVPTDLATTGSADSTAVSVPEGYEEAVVLYVTYNAFLMDGDPRWNDTKTLYEHKMASLEEAATRGYVDQPAFIMGGGGLGGLPFGGEDW